MLLNRRSEHLADQASDLEQPLLLDDHVAERVDFDLSGVRFLGAQTGHQLEHHRLPAAHQVRTEHSQVVHVALSGLDQVLDRAELRQRERTLLKRDLVF